MVTMKVVVFAVFVALANATSHTYPTGAGRYLHRPELTATRTERKPEQISRVQETLHQETGDAAGNRVGGFISKDNEGNVRAIRYAAGPTQVYSGQHQQKETVYGISPSLSERHSYGYEDRPVTLRYGRISSPRSVSFTTPVGSTYSLYPQVPHHGSAGRYF